MAWLVTGGAGYIGAHVVRALQRAGMDCVVLDDLSSGRATNLPAGVPFVRGGVEQLELVDKVVRGYRVTGCIHLAGTLMAGFSSERPLAAYDSITGGFRTLLTVLTAHRVDRVVYSSTAAVYGPPETSTVTEGAPTAPTTSYGRTKLIGEWMLQDLERATGLRHTSLRSVNVMGSATPAIADVNPYHLLPRVFDDLRSGRVPHIHGADFPTPTAPRCATSCLPPTWPPRTWPPRGGSTRASRWSPPTTSAPAPAGRCAASWRRSPAPRASASSPR